MDCPIHVIISYLKLFSIVLLLYVTSRSCVVVSAEVEDDVKCLKGVKVSLRDPENKLGLWTFTNTTVTSICTLVGVSCWNAVENRIFSLELVGMKLLGQVPEPLKYCHSLQLLNLSNNDLSGTIPAQICSWLPYLVTLDLSNNNISGSIPPELGSCIYLNTLILSNNRLSGHIPYELSNLVRLQNFSIANNDLSGKIPSFFSGVSESHLASNGKFLVEPLGSKNGDRLSKKNLAIISAAVAFGATGALLLSFALGLYCRLRWARRRKRVYGIGRDDYRCLLIAHQHVEVSLLKTSLVKVKLADLMKTTSNFDVENIIVSTRKVTTYKAVLLDGYELAIKQLNSYKRGEKQFRSEMNWLGQLRHPNLAPLLGFCVVEAEKLRVYKHMSNGTLYSLLHGCNIELDWPTRFQIGLGAARGLAWLHHGFQPPSLHKNVCSSVILIDADFDARIMDFGLARFMTSLNENNDLDEFGYIAPEYSTTILLSLKGDMYGLGVVLLELVTGQKPHPICTIEDGFKANLVDWGNQLSKSGRINDAIDKALCGRGYDEEIV